ncbi:hypothetical protein IK1_06182 [Bacillus cereus VD146]|uniref:Uncharacterized protein n=2 Tax=Bacillus cereus TaxID=1396 RepID=R8MEL0_BACCX|nr:hypothetical protein IGA_04756 [Bacillus cereus HuA3-9]EOP32203.1 hypothetical protein IK1_06182 [Bacillus cereus VD146]
MKFFFILSALSAIILPLLNKTSLAILFTSLFFILAIFFSKPRFIKK